MAASDAVWAIDLGNNSLKALRLVAVGDAIQVIGFDHIPHGKIVSGTGISPAERDELIAISLRQFVQRNDIGFDPIIISVPSQNSFARFVTLPPVEAKRIPEIIRFEAAQQIPFDMSEVQWDHMLLSDPDSAEKKVGLFAIKNEVVNAAMEYFEREDLQVSYVQIASMALYNYLLFDRPDLVSSDKRASVVVNIGADSTDLVVCTASGVWQRCIMMGGNAFTNAIAETFKLSFEKAEKLKRTAPVSKYARQIFQAMRPVFTDWTGELQRSLGFYTSSNPDVKISRIIAMGGGTKLRGLVKYAQQTLQIPVEKPDAFKRLAVAPGISAAKFHENVGDFGVVYGLGLQGVGMARIESNLLPTNIARSMAWAGKTKYFVGAAIMLLLVSALCLGRVVLEKVNYTNNGRIRSTNNRVAAEGEQAAKKFEGGASQETEYQQRIRKQFEKFQYRAVVPQLYEILQAALPNAKTNPEQKELYAAYAQGDAQKVMQVKRSDRKQIFLTNVSIFYSDNLETAKFGQTALARKDAMMQNYQMGAEEDSGYGDDMLAQMREIYGEDYLQKFGIGTSAQAQKDVGFVISIVGYSPYSNIMALLDPANVKEDPRRWGYVTRLENLKQFLGLDANSPFELYSRKAEHFKLEPAPVEFETAPLGIGIVDVIPDANNTARTTPTTYMGGFNSVNGTQILVDPLTNERIDAKILLDQNGRPRMSTANKPLMEVHDYWFSLDFKLLWTKGPQAAASTGGATGATGPTRSTAAPVSSPAPTRSAPAPRPARKSSKKLGGFGD
jgi:type IV pilus assembly protein PilM